MRGRIQSARGERGLALEDFRRAAELEPENTGYALSYAGMLHDAGRIDEAMALLQDQDREPMVLFTSALYALELGDRASAKAAFAALTELEPAADVAAERAYLAGQLAEELDDTEGALTWYGRVDGGPRLADAQLRSAILLARNERWPQAQTKLRHLQNGQEDIAAAAFRVEATLLGERGEAEKALATFGRGLALLPDNRELLFGRALYAESVDEVDVALRDLRRLVELDPDNPDALNALGYTLADRTDEFDEAYRLIEKALAARPDEPAIIDSMGWVLYRLGRLDEARGYLERAYSLQQDPEIAAHLGEVLWQLDRRDEARRIWSEALGANPDADIVKETRARLEAR